MKCIVCHTSFNAPPSSFGVPNPDMCRTCAARSAKEEAPITISPGQFVPTLMAMGLTREQAVAEAKKRGLPRKYWSICK